MLANRITPIETATKLSDARVREADAGRERKVQQREAARLAANPPRMCVRLAPGCDCASVIEALRRALYDHPGMMPVSVVVPGPNGDRTVNLGTSWTVDSDNGFVSFIRGCSWVDDVEIRRN